MNIREAFMKLIGNNEESPADDEAIKTFVGQVAEALGMEQYKAVLKRADEVIKSLTDRIDVLESLVAKLAADDVERVKSLVTEGDWTKDLFTASQSGEPENDETAAKAKDDVKDRKQDSPLGMETFFGGGQ